MLGRLPPPEPTRSRPGGLHDLLAGCLMVVHLDDIIELFLASSGKCARIFLLGEASGEVPSEKNIQMPWEFFSGGRETRTLGMCQWFDCCQTSFAVPSRWKFPRNVLLDGRAGEVTSRSGQNTDFEFSKPITQLLSEPFLTSTSTIFSDSGVHFKEGPRPRFVGRC